MKKFVNDVLSWDGDDLDALGEFISRGHALFPDDRLFGELDGITGDTIIDDYTDDIGDNDLYYAGYDIWYDIVTRLYRYGVISYHKMN